MKERDYYAGPALSEELLKLGFPSPGRYWWRDQVYGSTWAEAWGEPLPPAYPIYLLLGLLPVGTDLKIRMIAGEESSEDIWRVLHETAGICVHAPRLADAVARVIITIKTIRSVGG